MKDLTEKNFGPLIAFCLPGFIFLIALSKSFPEIQEWLATSPKEAPTIGGFFYSTLASLSLGLLLSAVRWLIVDHLLFVLWRIFRCPRPEIDFAKLMNKEKFAAFNGFVENHYRYYQYYSNSLVALTLGFVVYILPGDKGTTRLEWLGFVAMLVTLLLASNDSFRKYHVRAAAVINGGDNDDQRISSVKKPGKKGKESEKVSEEDGEEDTEGGEEEKVT